MTTFPHTPLTVPPLENGDRLSRDEFERRYAAMADTKGDGAGQLSPGAGEAEPRSTIDRAPDIR